MDQSQQLRQACEILDITLPVSMDILNQAYQKQQNLIETTISLENRPSFIQKLNDSYTMVKQWIINYDKSLKEPSPVPSYNKMADEIDIQKKSLTVQYQANLEALQQQERDFLAEYQKLNPLQRLIYKGADHKRSAENEQRETELTATYQTTMAALDQRANLLKESPVTPQTLDETELSRKEKELAQLTEQITRLERQRYADQFNNKLPVDVQHKIADLEQEMKTPGLIGHYLPQFDEGRKNKIQKQIDELRAPIGIMNKSIAEQTKQIEMISKEIDQIRGSIAAAKSAMNREDYQQRKAIEQQQRLLNRYNSKDPLQVESGVMVK